MVGAVDFAPALVLANQSSQQEAGVDISSSVQLESQAWSTQEELNIKELEINSKLMFSKKNFSPFSKQEAISSITNSILAES